jgi:TolB-like protein/DNA-binding SARP family transcriptional activator/Tfp pilus assembly protein PilF
MQDRAAHIRWDKRISSSEMEPPARIQLRLLGRLSLAYSDVPDPIRLSTRKAGALIAYLAMSPEQTASREELATLLWGGCTDQQARQSLRQALVLLRKDLRWSHFISADTAVVRLQPALWSVDACEFEDLSTSSDPKDLARAADLFGGEFLTGLNIDEEGFDEWINVQRQRMQLAASRLCEIYAARPDLVSDRQQAVAVVERLMGLDPLREDWQRLALTLYARYRGKNEALAQAEVFAATLQRELGVAPGQETRALVEKIRASASALERSPIEIVAAQVTSVPPETLAPIAPPPIEHLPEASGDVARPGGWTRVWSTRNVAAMLALGGVIALGAAGLSYKHLLPGRHGEQTAIPAGTTMPQRAQSQVASSDDPWQPPAPADQAGAKAGVTRSSGLAAILILPFTSAGDPSAQSSLSADLMTDDLTNALSRIGGLRVISRTTAMSYHGQQVNPTAIGRELGVHYVLEGKIAVQGADLRASIELIETKSGSRVWSARYDRAGPDSSTVLDDIVRSVGRELELEITHAERAMTAQDQDVRALVHKGFSAMSDAGRLGVPSLEQANTYFTEALAREPGNPRALTGLGAYHVQMAVNLYAPDPAPHLANAEALLLQVIERHPGIGGPYRLMGVLNIARGRAEAAAQWLQREIEINPSDAPAYAQLGRTMMMRGHPAEGIKYILYAMRLSPRDYAMAFWLGHAAMAELEQGHDDKAIAYLDRQHALKPGHPRGLVIRAAVDALSGNLDAARSRLGELRKAYPHLSSEKLIERYFGDAGADEMPRLREGLRLALAAPPDPWQSPRLPSQSKAEVAAPAKPLISLLVLPFKTFRESTGSTELLAEMVVDDLTNLLSRVQFMRVISRQTALTFKGQAIDVAAVGAELRVQYVLDGSMRMQGDKLRVNIELIDPKTRLPVWSTRIEREDADRSGVLDEIVGRLARELQFEPVGIEAERHAKDQDVDALITRGWAALQTITPASYRQAEAYFREALERDPQSVAAQTGLGAFHARIGLHDNGEPREHLDKARDLLQDAIRRNSQSGIAHFYFGLALKRPPTFQQAIEQFERAIELNPSLAAAYAHMGDTLAQTGRPSEGIEHIKYAMRLSPRDPSLGVFLNMAGLVEIELGDFHVAIKYLQRAIALRPSYERPWAGLAAAHALGGNIDEAHGDAKRLRDFVPDLNIEALIDRFGTKNSRLREGLSLAFAPPLEAATAPAPGIR